MARQLDDRGVPGAEQSQETAVGLCIFKYCAHVMFFIDGNFQELTDKERKEAFEDQRVLDLIYAIAEMKDDRQSTH